MLGKEGRVICVIGDGALTGGLAYEALNNIGRSKENLIIILNDNKMSIDRSVGGFRASCYNAMPLDGVKVLVDCMREFAKR